jgi:plastocyanin
MLKINKIKNPTIAFILICVSIFSINCAKEETPIPSGGSNSVSMQSMSFSPGTITIKAGEPVTWTNNDGTAHTVTSDTGVFDSGNMTNGTTFSFTFPTAGTFAYHCTYHGGMTGTVIVE